jgi:hypothetical protein
MTRKEIIGALALIGATAAWNVGCVAHGHASASAHAEAEAPVVFVETPTLVYVESDVWVVRDYDYAVYYVDGYYWVYRDSVWYRSRAYDRGWATVEVSVVPSVVVHSNHHAYVHYHGSATAKTRVAPREYVAAEPHHGPPDHAAAQHGGPPGHDETPGVGNQRKAAEGEDVKAKKHKKDKKDKKDKY